MQRYFNASTTIRPPAKINDDTLYYVFGFVAILIVIAVLLYFFLFRKKKDSDKKDSDKKDPDKKDSDKKDSDKKDPDKKDPDKKDPSSNYPNFRSVDDDEMCLGLNDKKTEVLAKKCKKLSESDSIKIINGKLQINEMCIRKDKNNSFNLVPCADVSDTLPPASYDENTKILKNGTRCLYYDDDDLKMDESCKTDKKKYKWTKV